MKELNVGDPAPDLPDMEEKKVCVSGFKAFLCALFSSRGKHTGTLEAKSFTEEKKEFSALDVPIIGISPDPPQSHRKFIGKQDLKMNLLPVTRIYNKHRILLADN